MGVATGFKLSARERLARVTAACKQREPRRDRRGDRLCESKSPAKFVAVLPDLSEGSDDFIRFRYDDLNYSVFDGKTNTFAMWPIHTDAVMLSPLIWASSFPKPLSNRRLAALSFLNLEMRFFPEIVPSKSLIIGLFRSLPV